MASYLEFVSADLFDIYVSTRLLLLSDLCRYFSIAFKRSNCMCFKVLNLVALRFPCCLFSYTCTVRCKCLSTDSVGIHSMYLVFCVCHSLKVLPELLLPCHNCSAGFLLCSTLLRFFGGLFFFFQYQTAFLKFLVLFFVSNHLLK